MQRASGSVLKLKGLTVWCVSKLAESWMEAWRNRICQRQLAVCQSLMLPNGWEVAALLVTTVPSPLTSGEGPKTKFWPVECGRIDTCYFQSWISHPPLSPTGCQCQRWAQKPLTKDDRASLSLGSYTSVQSRGPSTPTNANWTFYEEKKKKLVLSHWDLGVYLYNS